MGSDMDWEQRPDKTSDHLVLHLRDPDGWYEAMVKWDGCIHFYQAGNVPFDATFGQSEGPRDESACDDYIHICDLDDFIARLAALRDAARAHFGEKEWPDGQ